MAEISYTEMLERVASVYGASDEIWGKVALGSPTDPEIANLINRAGVSIQYSSNGNVLSYAVNDVVSSIGTSGNIGTAIDSNISGVSQTITGGGSVGSIEKVATETGESLKASSGVTSVATGAKAAGNFILKEVAPAVAAASIGIKLGKTIDKALYNINPNFWDSHGMAELNPDTWNSITAGDTSTGASLFNMIFGINPDTGETSAYIDENAFAYMTAYMNSMGVFSSGDSLEIDNEIYEQIPFITSYGYNNAKNGFPFSNGTIFFQTVRYPDESTPWSTSSYAKCGSALGLTGTAIYRSSVHPVFLQAALEPFHSSNSSESCSTDLTTHSHTFGNFGTIYYEPHNLYSYLFKDTLSPLPVNNSDHDLKMNELLDFAAAYFFAGKVSAAVEGIDNQEGAAQFNSSGITDNSDIQSVLNALKTQYPDLFRNAVTTTNYNPATGQNETHTYVPAGIPYGVNDWKNDSQPTTNSNAQGNNQNESGVNPEGETSTETQTLIEHLIDLLNPTDTINGGSTGKGDTPAVVIPSGSASALWKIYNPTQGQIDSFGAWLWSDNFVDQIKKVFNNPMEAIIGLHKVFCPVPAGGSQSIKVGYLDSGVSSRVVTGQYVTIPCGTVNLPEYFGNVMDYAPYTRVQCFLPFIGIVPIDVGDVMRSSITVTYHVDVLTGACLAEISVQRDASGGALYTYSGNASVQYPLSSGSYMGIVAGALSIAGSIAGSIASGGALAPMAIGASAGALSSMHTSVQHSGSISGNAGAMGGKIPYLIISRPQSYMADNFKHFQGLPENKSVVLAQCSGFTRCSAVHVENLTTATEEEKAEIERQLMEGVIL